MEPSDLDLGERIRAANSRLLVEGDLDAAEMFFATDYVAHLTGKKLAGGPGAVRKFVAAIRRSFTDLDVEVEILARDGERVSWQRTLSAKHARSFQGFPPTRAALTWREMATSRFEGGKIAEEWVLSDLAEQLLRARHA